jgi:type I restriction enzyme S subunit
MYTVFETNDDINKDYLFMLMKSDIFMKKYQVIGQGSINRRMTISFDSLSRLTMPFPPLQEQNEITRITNQIDKNINFSLNKLSQTQSLKKSLMQDLLTGKVRVTVN